MTRILIAAAALAALLVAAPAAASAASPEGQPAQASVVKGKTAPLAAFPWLAAAVYDGPIEGFACTATVVAPRLILTAGHCATAQSGRLLSAANYHVIWGTADLRRSDPARTAEVTQVLAFPGYNPNNLLHDAALLVLAAPVGAPAIALASAADAGLYAKGTGLTIAGWGLTDGFAAVQPAVFRSAETQIGGSAYCRREAALLTPAYDPTSQLCATDSRRHEVGACNGDSGGPGIARRPDGSPVQVGIISIGGPFCDLSFPEIQTRVDQISPWVAEWAAAVEAGAPPPPVVPPPPFRLPRMSLGDARVLARIGLASDFHRRFVKGRFKRLDCRRVDREKVKCQVFWYLAGRVYGGSATVFYSLPREGSLISMRYRIRRVGAGCWLRRGSVKRCPGVLFHR